MMSEEANEKISQAMFPLSSEVVELVVLMPANQFSALEGVATRLNLTVGQLLRRTVSDFLIRPNSSPTQVG